SDVCSSDLHVQMDYPLRLGRQRRLPLQQRLRRLKLCAARRRRQRLLAQPQGAEAGERFTQEVPPGGVLQRSQLVVLEVIHCVSTSSRLSIALATTVRENCSSETSSTFSTPCSLYAAAASSYSLTSSSLTSSEASCPAAVR